MGVGVVAGTGLADWLCSAIPSSVLSAVWGHHAGPHRNSPARCLQLLRAALACSSRQLVFLSQGPIPVPLRSGAVLIFPCFRYGVGVPIRTAAPWLSKEERLPCGLCVRLVLCNRARTLRKKDLPSSSGVFWAHSRNILLLLTVQDE